MIKRTTRNKEGEVIETILYTNNYEFIESWEDNVKITCLSLESTGGLFIRVKLYEDCDEFFEFDSEEKLIKHTFNDTGIYESYKYNDEGKVIEVIEVEDSKEKQMYLYEYNNKGQLIRKLFNLSLETLYEYDNKGRLIKKDSGKAYGIESYEYDDQGKLVKLNNNIHGAESYEYDDKGNKIKTKYLKFGYEESYKYDKKNRLIKVIRSNGEEESYKYIKIKIKE